MKRKFQCPKMPLKPWTWRSIVTSAPGPSRHELVQDVIGALQEVHIRHSKGLGSSSLKSPPSSSPAFAALSLNKDAANEHVGIEKEKQETFCRATRHIKELDGIPGLEDYHRHYINQPFVVRRFAQDWPALDPFDENEDQAATALQDPIQMVQAHPDCRNGKAGSTCSSGRALVESCLLKSGKSTPMSDGASRSFRGKIFSQRQGGLLQARSSKKTRKTRLSTLLSMTSFHQFDQLRRDVLVPDIVYSCPPAPDGLASPYVAPWTKRRARDTS
ncbi:hypothetical protein L7F22_022368 [Adiantum nelumboides]|nr:hypothetical protein [Adiantum nelumboides]